MKRTGQSQVVPAPAPSLEQQLAQKNMERAQRCLGNVQRALQADRCMLDVVIETVRDADGGFRLRGRAVVIPQPAATAAQTPQK